MPFPTREKEEERENLEVKKECRITQCDMDYWKLFKETLQKFTDKKGYVEKNVADPCSHEIKS